ncbi:MAG TPA: tetratricopeptide repeat protein, partial [Kofleriaceae bacterium]
MSRAALMRRLSLVLALTAGSASADVEGKLNQYEQEARQISQTLPTLDDSTKAPPNRRLVDAQVAFSLGNYDDAAVVLFELAGRVGPEQEPAAYYLAETLYAKGDKGAARSYYQGIVEKNAPGSKYYQPSLLRLIEIAIAQNDPTDVDATIAAIDRASPPIANAAYVKAKWAFSQARYDDAIQQFAQVPKGSTFEAQAAYYTATAYVAKGDLPKAQELFTTVSQRVPTSANDRRVMELADLALGRLYYERDQLGKAIDSYLLIDRSSDLFPDALYEVGWVYVKNKQYDKALRALELLALSNPNSNRTATVRILEGNLHIRKAQMNRVAQVENTLDANAVDPSVEYAKATEVFTSTHDAYYPSYVALEAMLENKSADPADYLAQLAERETSVFQAVPPIPDAAAQYLREEPETQRIVANQQDLGTIKAHLTEAESTIERLEGVLAANDKSVVYPAMQSKRD